MLAKLYKIINIVLVLSFFVFFIFLFITPQNKVFLGVLQRFLLSALIIFNALYLVLTNEYTFLIKKGQENKRRLLGVILLIFGLGMLITAIMGYGINGYPRMK